METLRINTSELAIFSKFEEAGLTELKQHIEGKSARKNNVEMAWDTLKLYAENRFRHYPEIFPIEAPSYIRDLVAKHVCGVLKNRDKFGRRILFFDMSKWDINDFSLDDLTIAGVIGAEAFWRNPEILENGLIIVENTIGFGMGHAKQHTMSRMNRMRNVFVQSFPVSIQGIFYLRMPYLFTLIFKMSRHLFPKKIRSRMNCYSSNQEPTELYDIASPDILPEWMGGKLKIEDAVEDAEFYERFLPHKV
ncbi:Retinaldehyde-binding protein 1 [Orchesella cincta]|uniref:Retinaldehyde-binding protein 1 n=1 Tax=Orchesella cincta TaxID=48709 RepID=A0A1D2M569_ORCCI|nr:Retinaldehyde-binding protein 1 [Orchesella cincta]